MPLTVLVVEDDAKAREYMLPLLAQAGHEMREAETIQSAYETVARGEADIVVLDVQLPDGDGMDLLARLRREAPSLPVIMVTGFGDINMAVEAMKRGALDFIPKPLDMKRLNQAVVRAGEQVLLRRELDHLRRQDPSDDWVQGESPVMKRVVHEMERVAPSSTTVLLTGECGTGKDVLARAIHARSPRATRLFVPANCANFTKDLLAAELFGHEANAFTDAGRKRKDGMFATADGGTIFLDEISTMQPELQASLLRTLENRTIRRVGGTTEVKVDVRVIAATNHDLPELVRTGRFRSDLFYRLNVFELHLPPLRERREDIPALVGFFVQQLNREMGRNVLHVQPQALDALQRAAWPGNVRQLKNAVERAMLFVDGDSLELGHFAPDITGALESTPLPV